MSTKDKPANNVEKKPVKTQTVWGVRTSEDTVFTVEYQGQKFKAVHMGQVEREDLRNKYIPNQENLDSVDNDIVGLGVAILHRTLVDWPKGLMRDLETGEVLDCNKENKEKFYRYNSTLARGLQGAIDSYTHKADTVEDENL